MGCIILLQWIISKPMTTSPIHKSTQRKLPNDLLHEIILRHPLFNV
jgi:hypothetical protein